MDQRQDIERRVAEIDRHESARRMFRYQDDSVARVADEYLRSVVSPGPILPRINEWQEQAELYMEGLMEQVREREAALEADQELSMVCWQGQEQFWVQSVSMPSHNVVALHCVDSSGATIQLTGHMHAITFSFRVHEIEAPFTPKKIGFDLPSGKC
jgi:hypothetical protein